MARTQAYATRTKELSHTITEEGDMLEAGSAQKKHAAARIRIAAH